MRDHVRKMLQDCKGKAHDVEISFPKGPTSPAYLEAWSELLQHGYWVCRMEANGRTVGTLRFCFGADYHEASGQANIASGVVAKIWQASVWLNNDLDDNVLRLGLQNVYDKGAK